MAGGTWCVVTAHIDGPTTTCGSIREPNEISFRLANTTDDPQAEVWVAGEGGSSKLKVEGSVSAPGRIFGLPRNNYRPAHGQHAEHHAADWGRATHGIALASTFANNGGTRIRAGWMSARSGSDPILTVIKIGPRTMAAVKFTAAPAQQKG